MSLESLYFNISTRKFVRSSTSPQSVPPPVWGHNDVRDFGVTFVQSIGIGRVQVITSIASSQVNVSTVAAPNSVLATYTASPAVNNEHPFLLTLGSSLDAAMSGQTTAVLFSGQFRIVTATGENRYPFEVYIVPKQATGTTPDTSSEDGYLTKSQQAALYLPKEIPVGTRPLITDEVTGIQYAIAAINGKLELVQL